MQRPSEAARRWFRPQRSVVRTAAASGRKWTTDAAGVALVKRPGVRPMFQVELTASEGPSVLLTARHVAWTTGGGVSVRLALSLQLAWWVGVPCAKAVQAS